MIRVIGITGSIGMGKSTITRMFARRGIKCCNADTIVHELMQKNGRAYPLVMKAFPDALDKNKNIDRKKLGAIVFADMGKRRLLERILHPLVKQEEMRFAENAIRMGARLVVLDIPLLFETGAQDRLDEVVVASAPPLIQKQRVLRRQNMTAQRFAHILSLQMPDRQKRKHADCVISTGLGRGYSMRRINAYLKSGGII